MHLRRTHICHKMGGCVTVSSTSSVYGFCTWRRCGLYTTGIIWHALVVLQCWCWNGCREFNSSCLFTFLISPPLLPFHSPIAAVADCFGSFLTLIDLFRLSITSRTMAPHLLYEWCKPLQCPATDNMVIDGRAVWYCCALWVDNTLVLVAIHSLAPRVLKSS